MSEAPLEWPATAYILHPSVKSYADLVSNPERRKYIRGDRAEALEDKLEKLIIGAETVLEEWDRGDEAAFREAIEEMRADVEEAKEGMT